MAIYDYYREHQSPSQAPNFGTFWLYAKVDFAKQNMGINDDLRLFKVKDKWVLRNGYTRCLVASGVANTIDLGTAQNGTELDAAANANSAGDWLQMDTLGIVVVDDTVDVNVTQIPITADGYIWLDNNTAAASSGIFEVMLEVMVGPNDAEGTDSLTED